VFPACVCVYSGSFVLSLLQRDKKQPGYYLSKVNLFGVAAAFPFSIKTISTCMRIYIGRHTHSQARKKNV